MNIRYIGPFDAVEVGAQIFARGVTVSVPSELAGRVPDPRVAVAHAELRDAIGALDHNLAVALRDEIIGLDAGEGLLAQECWELVPAEKTKKGDES